MRVISFYSEDLKVDYLSLNLQFDNLNQIQKTADYLGDTFGCKSTLLDQSTKLKKTLVESAKRNYSASFIINSTKYWRGTTLCFKGNSAQLFYEVLKSKKLDWTVFDLDSTNLGRIDVCYDRKLNSTDRYPHLFLENSCQTINEKNDKQHAKLSKNGRILWIGKRSSSNFFRVYLKPGRKKIRFEIEVKKDEVKNFQHDFFTGQFERFEELLTEHFYHQATRLFDLENSYCDWLRNSFRRVRKLPPEEVLVNSLSTSFLTEKPENDLVKLEFVYRLIQLVNYMKSLKGSSNSVLIGDRTYQTFEFQVNHFLEFIGKRKNNHYQIRKLIEFLESLQDIKPILDYFSDGGFRRYVALPYLKIEKRKGWWVELSICRELRIYRYPFHLPESFLNSQDNFELKVKFAFLQSFCGVRVRKTFPTQEFLEQKSISNSKSAKLKKCIVKVFHELKDLKVIEPEFEVLTKKNRLNEVTGLTSGLVSRSKLIFYRENIHNKFNY